LSGLTRAILATLLARRIRDFRKPRREMSAQALVMRVTGFNAMLGLIYRFHRPRAAAGNRRRPRTRHGRASRRGEVDETLGNRERAGAAKSGDNT
jgi:hypothetical protein